MLLIVCGLPGSGKSTLAKALESRLDAVRLNSDNIRKELFEKPDYTIEEKRKVYQEMKQQAETLVKQGRNVILDATFFKKEFRGMMKGIAEEPFIIKCLLAEEETKRRLDLREQTGKSKSDANYGVYLDVKNQFEPIEGPHLEVDCSIGNEKMVKLVEEFIGGNSG